MALRLRDLARDGEAPGASWRPRALWGLRQVARAAALVATDPGLRRSALLPTSLTFVGCAVVAALIAWRREGRFAEVAFATFVAVSSMPSTLLWPLWKRLGLESRRALGAPPGEEERPGERYVSVVWRESAKAVRQAIVVAVGLAPVFLVVELLPGVGHGITVVLGLLWAWYWVVLDSLEIPVELSPGRLGPGAPTWFERVLLAVGARSRWLRPFGLAGRVLGWLARPWRHQASFTEGRAWESSGFGAGSVAFLAIPVVGVFFRAVAITAATALVVRDEPPPEAPIREVAVSAEPA